MDKTEVIMLLRSAKSGHKKWVELFEKELPKTIKDVSTCEIASLAKLFSKEEEIIKRIDNTVINNVRELLNSAGIIEIGRRVQITVMRDKKPIALDAVIGERPQSIEEEATKEGEAKAGNWRGMSVENLDLEFANRFRTKEKQGVVVIDVQPGSCADEAGLSAGDIILAINKQAIKNISDYEKITKDLRGSVLVRTTRGFFLIKEQSEKK